MRTYLILREKTAQFNADTEIQSLIAELHDRNKNAAPPKYSAEILSETR